ncbi:sigma-54 dependent transcriptional regulator [Sulfuricella sp.]|uniref:sigma-54-dependent transcriptional regulator n=1 Tax=Sulfuricella sp. TaxID=2099377 RepID=UPI002C597CF0|nr:sigma-54 dependent transcriptional regulator [Sulfuricella sp.]HUX64567.1 sigma-54 dependent transcriptional regulator [Sulfuricella sp.]
MPNLPTVLVVDDEVRSQESLRRTLEEEFYVFTASGAEDALALLEHEWMHVILCDQRMPGTSGVDFLKQVRERWPDTVRIILSGYTETEDIIAGINAAGIYQYITKPWHPESLLLSVRAAAQLYRLQQENQQASLELRTTEPVLRRRVEAKREALKSRNDFLRLVRSRESPVNRVCQMAQRIAPYDISILITGESGTGKELLARAIHYGSSRADRVFVIENCGALSDSLLESELFGHKRGAFTGAFENRVGLFEQADGGTIFLDEIGDTTPAFQVKLLRVLQEGEIRPLGSSRSRKVDVRVISATNRNLEEDVRNGRFREDLYYRLTTFALHVPPLRERVQDIRPLADHLLGEATRALDKPVKGFTAEAIDCLCAYHWPGNVRELQNEIIRMLALVDGEYLGAELLTPRVLRAAGQEQESDTPLAGTGVGPLKERIEVLEKSVLKETLIRHRWNKSRAAQELGLSRVGLRAKLQRFGLEKK